jgi:hypothetical protein
MRLSNIWHSLKTGSIARRYFDFGVIATLVFLLSAFWLVTAIVAVQGKLLLGGDGQDFASASMFLRNRGLLANPFYDPLAENPQHLILWHGWLMPWLQGILSPTATYGSFLLSCVLISVAVLAIYSKVLANQQILVRLLMLTTISTVLYYHWGRPELVVSLLIAIFLLVRGSVYRSVAIDGILLGLCFCANPTACVSLGLLWALDASKERAFRAFLSHTVAAVAAAVGTVFLATTLIAQYDIVDWLRGLIEHAAIIGARDHGDSYLRYYIAAPEFPGLFLAVIFGVITLIDASQPKTPLRIFLCITFGVWMLTRLESPHAVYNAIFMIPLAVYASKDRLDFRSASKFFRVVAITSFLLSAAIASLATTRQLFLNVDLVAFGVSAGDLIDAVDAQDYEFLPETNSPLVATNLYLSSGSSEQNVEAGDQFSADRRIVTQAYTGVRGPLERRVGQRVLLDRFHTDRPQFLEIPLGYTRKDWAFAIIEVDVDHPLNSATEP